MDLQSDDPRGVVRFERRMLDLAHCDWVVRLFDWIGGKSDSSNELRHSSWQKKRWSDINVAGKM